MDVGDDVEVRCDSGFELFGPSSVRCQSDGNFDDDFPQCFEGISVQLPRIKILNRKII